MTANEQAISECENEWFSFWQILRRGKRVSVHLHSVFRAQISDTYLTTEYKVGGYAGSHLN
jgi:hypothetical protein